MKIALVVLDTLRKDAFDTHFDWLSGHRFKQAYSTSHWTVPAHASLFVGQYASHLGVHSRTVTLDTTEQTIAERLRDEGYQTIGFSANPQITAQFGFDSGFIEYDTGWRARPFQDAVFDWRAYGADRPRWKLYFGGLYHCFTRKFDTLDSIKYGLEIKRGQGDDGASRALSFLKNKEFRKDAFVFVNLMEAHGPYKAPSSYRTVEPVTVAGLPDTIGGADYDVDRTRTAYGDCVRYLSDMYEQIHRELTNSGFDLIITCSDHGEMFGEYDGVWQHDYGLYPQLTHVPLVLSGNLVREYTSNEPVSLLDVHATIEDIGQIDQESMGESLFDNSSNRRILTEYHGIPLKNKYQQLVCDFGQKVVSRYDEGMTGLVEPNGEYYWQTFHGIKPESTPDEKRYIINENTRNLRNRVKTETETTVPSHLESTLRDLGYIQ